MGYRMDGLNMEDPVHTERRLSPEDCQRLCEDALSSFRSGDLESARALFLQARNHDPFSWRPIQGLGVLAFQEGRLDDAWSLLLAAFEAAPEDEDNAENLAAIGKELKREEQVITLLAQTARRFPELKHLDAFRPTPGAEDLLAIELCAKGEELLAMELWREAMFPFMEALEHRPRDPAAWNGMGISAWRQNYRQVALEFFHKAIETLPSDEDSVLNYSESMTRNGQGNAVLGTLLNLGVPRELCAKVLDLQAQWSAAP
jgi:tetratricopeptide (TPR) repeat protein